MYKTTVRIDGMMCSMCEAHVNDAVRRALPVERVASSHTKNRTEIHSQQPLDEEALRKVIEATGYTVLDVRTEAYEKKGFRLFGKRG